VAGAWSSRLGDERDRVFIEPGVRGKSPAAKSSSAKGPNDKGLPVRASRDDAEQVAGRRRAVRDGDSTFVWGYGNASSFGSRKSGPRTRKLCRAGRPDIRRT